MSRPLSPVVVLVHLVATWFMVGLIWTIHFVHYPLFAEVGEATYVAYQAAHVDRIGVVLALPWAVEGITAAMILLLAFSRNLRRESSQVGVLTLAVICIAGLGQSTLHVEHGQLAFICLALCLVNSKEKSKKNI